MKELSIEEKAKRYDELLTRAKNTIEVNQAIPDIVECVKSLFPELAENKGEKIRKIISDILLIDSDEIREILDTNNVLMQDIDAWLEKQDNQDNDEDVDILHRFSFYSYKDEPNVLYLSGFYVNEEYRNKGIGTKILEVTDEVAKSLNCYAIRLKTKKGSDAERLYRTHGYNSLATEDKDEIWLEKQGEQNSDDKAEPKFKVGDTIAKKHNSDIHDFGSFTITDITGGKYWYNDRIICDISEQDEWEIYEPVRQKPAWSEEDKYKISRLTSYLKRLGNDVYVEWLESLKEKYSWKPSDEQMKALENAMSMGAKLDSLYNELKKLKG